MAKFKARNIAWEVLHWFGIQPSWLGAQLYLRLSCAYGMRVLAGVCSPGYLLVAMLPSCIWLSSSFSISSVVSLGFRMTEPRVL